MRKREFDLKTVGLLVALLLLSAGAVAWTVRQVWTDHDVSDPGVTLQWGGRWSRIPLDVDEPLRAGSARAVHGVARAGVPGVRGGSPSQAANTDPGATDFWWNVYLATDDCAGTEKRIEQAGGRLVQSTMDVMDQGRMAIAVDPVGAQFGLWEGRSFVGAGLVNEPNSLLRNDLVTPTPGPAREFYATVFDFTLDPNPDLPGLDFTFLRRPDGHEIGGIMGAPSAPSSRWGTLFEVTDTDAAVASARAAGGTATDPQDFVYGRVASITDPFGATFDVGARPSGQQG